jgi:hypothetical protein
MKANKIKENLSIDKAFFQKEKILGIVDKIKREVKSQKNVFYYGILWRSYPFPVKVWYFRSFARKCSDDSWTGMPCMCDVH